jgi:hypothetical protein
MPPRGETECLGQLGGCLRSGAPEPVEATQVGAVKAKALGGESIEPVDLRAQAA